MLHQSYRGVGYKEELVCLVPEGILWRMMETSKGNILNLNHIDSLTVSTMIRIDEFGAEKSLNLMKLAGL
jgi:hypothetical protein